MKGIAVCGWYCLLVAVIGDMTVPFILAPFYKGYRHTTMAISVLGSRNSPVRLPFSLWMLAAGVLLIACIPAIYSMYASVSKPFGIATVFCVGIFALGACVLPCFFRVNETKDIVTLASRIHGYASAIGFILLLFVPLFLAILSCKAGNKSAGILALVSFIFALVCFTLFIMADKPEFMGTAFAKEGLWQRLSLLFMYLPLSAVAVKAIASSA